MFREAFNGHLMLGSSATITELGRQGEARATLTRDLKLRYSCPNNWQLLAGTNPTHVPKVDSSLLAVDPETCTPVTPFSAAT